MITEVKLRNWKSHSNTRIEFSPGTNCIIGIMGAGKSSILEAITFAFFSETPSTREKRIRIDDLIRSRPNRERWAEVEVSFIAQDGNEYRVKRRIELGRGTTHSELRDRDGKLLAGPRSREVTRAVEELIGVGFDVFTRAVYGEQNRIDQFLTVSRGRRIEKIDEMLGIDKLKDMRERGRKILRLISIKAEEVLDTIESLEKNKPKEKLDRLKSELSKKEEEVRRVSMELKNLIKREEKLKDEVSRLEETKRKIDLAKQKIEFLSEQIKSWKSELDEIGEPIEDSREVAERKLDVLMKEREEITRISDEITKLEMERNRMLGKIESLEKEISELRDEIVDLPDEKVVLELSEKVSELENEIIKDESNLGDLIGEIGRKKGLLEEILHEVSKMDQRIKELEERVEDGLSLEEVESELNDAKEKLNQTLEEISSLKRILLLKREGMNVIMEGVCPVCERRLSESEISSLMSRTSSELEELSFEISSLERERERLTSIINDLEDKKRRAIETENLLKIMEELIHQKKRKESESSSLTEELESLSRKERSLKEQISRKKEVLQSLREKLSEVESKLKKKEELAGRISERETILSEYKSLEMRISELRNKMTKDPRELEKEVEALKLTVRALDLKEKIMRAKEEISSTRKELEETKFDESDFNLKRELLLSLEREIGEKNNFLISSREMMSEMKKNISSLEEEVNILEKKRAELNEILEIEQLLKRFIHALERAQVRLREEFVESVNDVMAEIWPSLYPYGDYTGIRLEIDEGDYSLKLKHSSGNWIEVDGIASGGERTVASLALRIAFSIALAPGFGVLILDEPTHNLDSRAIEELIVTLRERVPKILKQTIIVTHEEKLESSATGFTYKLERDKDEDSPTSISFVSTLPVSGSSS